MKSVITENEFDKLPEHTQMYYLFCPKCRFFYLATKRNTHLCGDPDDISVEEMIAKEG